MSLPVALGVGAAGIATEHFFTVTLTSLPTAKRFFRDNEGKKDVRISYTIATILSLGFAVVLSYYLRRPEPLITAIVLSLIFIWLYEKAINA